MVDKFFFICKDNAVFGKKTASYPRLDNRCPLITANRADRNILSVGKRDRGMVSYRGPIGNIAVVAPMDVLSLVIGANNGSSLSASSQPASTP